MIYRFRVILDNDTKEDVFRDLEIVKDSSLKDLHELILLAFKFSGEEMSSFFTVDEEWNQIDVFFFIYPLKYCLLHSKIHCTF